MDGFCTVFKHTLRHSTTVLRPSFFLSGIALLLALRLWHFGADIDAPHDWRQCDTAHYIRDFYQNGIDLLHPAVCWMGAHDALALEFPLPEAIAALAYRMFGESIPLARLVFLCFFAGALLYFYKITDLLFGQQQARLATLVYLCLPLSIFYSRAIHIDFSALFPAHAMLYYYLVGVKNRRWKYILYSSLFAVPAVVIKAPYAFCFALPMFFFAIRQNALARTVRTGGFYLLPAVAFGLWQHHVNILNDAAPDWNYILHYRKMTQSAAWYFGNVEQRLSLYPWWILLQRGVLEVAGIGGIVFFLLGWRRQSRLPHFHFLLSWMLGLAVYVLIFFNLNFVHNYYQIPLMAPVAILCAAGLHAAASAKPAKLFVFLGLLAAANIAYTEKAYYKVAWEHLEAGRLIRRHTPDTALVIVTCGQMDCRNPKILYRAQRKGWSIEETALRPDVVGRLQREEGAGYWVYIGAGPPPAHMSGYLAPLSPPQVFDLKSSHWKLYIFELPLE